MTMTWLESELINKRRGQGCDVERGTHVLLHLLLFQVSCTNLLNALSELLSNAAGKKRRG